jgi:hypothetical protein
MKFHVKLILNFVFIYYFKGMKKLIINFIRILLLIDLDVFVELLLVKDWSFGKGWIWLKFYWRK